MTAVGAGPAGDTAVDARRALDQAWELCLRSIRAIRRNWTDWVGGLVFPLMLAAVYTAQFQRAIDLPGFPDVDSFLDYVVPASILQAVAFGATNAGTDLAQDIENGFFDRLVVSPVARTSIVVGRLAGSVVEATLRASILLGIFVAFGAAVAGGIGAVVVLLGTAVGLVLALGGVGVVIALRTGSQEAVSSTFPVVFVLLFLSSAFFPTALMTGWYQWVAERNPITLIIDPVRRLLIVGWSWSDAGQALGVAFAFAAAAIAWAVVALNRRLARA